jgi:SAM-dependent methyltransferase
VAKQGERDYFRNIGEEGVRHAIRKPFYDPDCWRYLLEIGAMMSMLPPPPARVLDLGCGTGWTSTFFAKRGYDVVGVDICEDMLVYANREREREGLDNLRFVAADYEGLTFDREFDAAIFFDALHHAMDEQAAIQAAFRALKPGGVCITSEPGLGHGDAPQSREAVRRFNVTEKDMPPEKIVALAKYAGFETCRVYPHPTDLNVVFYQVKNGVVLGPKEPEATGLRGRWRRFRERVHCLWAEPKTEPILWVGRSPEFLRTSGIVRLIKAGSVAAAA